VRVRTPYVSSECKYFRTLTWQSHVERTLSVRTTHLTRTCNRLHIDVACVLTPWVWSAPCLLMPRPNLVLRKYSAHIAKTRTDNKTYCGLWPWLSVVYFCNYHWFKDPRIRNIGTTSCLLIAQYNTLKITLYWFCHKKWLFAGIFTELSDIIIMISISWRPVMLWSQIKLTSYDVSDLHITGEFDNRLGTGRFLLSFSCVVTYRTGAGRRLYIKNIGRCPAGHRTMSYGARPAF